MSFIFFVLIPVIMIVISICFVVIFFCCFIFGANATYKKIVETKQRFNGDFL